MVVQAVVDHVSSTKVGVGCSKGTKGTVEEVEEGTFVGRR